MTPRELYAALDARRRALGWAWWQVAVALDVTEDSIRKARRGEYSQRLYERAPAWLERLPGQPREE